MIYQLFTDEQRRLLANLAQYYDAYIEAERAKVAAGNLPLHWKIVSGREYLYQIIDSRGNGKSLGPRSEATTARHQMWHEARERSDNAKALLLEVGRMYRSLRLGGISAEAAAILREADRRGMLGTAVIVVGTNAMPAYEIEAQSRIGAGLDETQDFDMAWLGNLALTTASSPANAVHNSIWAMLKAVDSTYTINSERPFQARNAKAYEVELLVAPSRVASLGVGDRPVPVPLPEQEWLLKGKFVDHVICGRDGSAARIVAPDPRWFALHKLWMSEQEKRNPLKRPKDGKQGIRMLDAIATSMPHYPLDEGFAAELPPELLPYFETWRATKTSRPPASSW
jgi:hypothetical protein